MVSLRGVGGQPIRELKMMVYKNAVEEIKRSKTMGINN